MTQRTASRCDAEKHVTAILLPSAGSMCAGSHTGRQAGREIEAGVWPCVAEIAEPETLNPKGFLCRVFTATTISEP